jgi:FKBP-type peptidyl-prolyl cis-trans isomerase
MQYEQYKDGQHALLGEILVGSGTELKSGMKAAVYYKGWLTNGTLFDQSKLDDKGQLQPFVVSIGAHQVIAGWEEGLVGMQVGGKRRLIVPPAVGYGSQGQAPIPGNAVLVFDVELLAAQ